MNPYEENDNNSQYNFIHEHVSNSTDNCDVFLNENEESHDSNKNLENHDFYFHKIQQPRFYSPISHTKSNFYNHPLNNSCSNFTDFSVDTLLQTNDSVFRHSSSQCYDTSNINLFI